MLKTITVAAILTLSPVASFAMCGGHSNEETASACTEGMVWDQDTGTCVDQVTG